MARLIARWQTRQKSINVRAPMMHSASGRYRPRASYAAPSIRSHFSGERQWRGQWRSGLDEIAPLQLAGVSHRGYVRLPWFCFQRRSGLVGHRADIFIRQAGEIVTELMNENVSGMLVRGRNCGLLVVNPAAAVARLVDHDSGDVVRGARSQIAQRSIVIGQHVTVQAENAELRQDRWAWRRAADVR